MGRSRHWSAQDSERGRVISDAASRRYLDQKKSLGILHPNGFGPAYNARPLSPHSQYVIECGTHCSPRAPEGRAEHIERNCPTRWVSARATCKHCACVALDDEVHLVEKSLKVLRQNGQKSQSRGPCESDHLQWPLGVELYLVGSLQCQ